MARLSRSLLLSSLVLVSGCASVPVTRYQWYTCEVLCSRLGGASEARASEKIKVCLCLNGVQFPYEMDSEREKELFKEVEVK